MQLIMGISSDGYVATGDEDRMDWLGQDDKAVFRLLTSVGGVCAASAKTRNLMPLFLPGRTVLTISRDHGEGLPAGHMTLQEFASKFCGTGWLLGGQHLALTAFREGLVSAAFLCYSDNPCLVAHGIPDLVTPMSRARFGEPVMETRVGSTLVRKFA